MDNIALIAMTSIIAASTTIVLGCLIPAYGESRLAFQALTGITQQPDAANKLTSTLFVSMAMVESTAIYSFVVTMIILFANPFWDYVSAVAK